MFIKASYIIAIFFITIMFNSKLFALRDPTQPYYFNNSIDIPIDALKLNGIIISRLRKIAIISGILVRVGDQISGNKVLAIGPNSVQLEGPNGKLTLFLIDQSFKKMPSSR